MKKAASAVATIEAAYTDFMGTAGAILVEPETNIKRGGADPRGDGAAVGY